MFYLPLSYIFCFTAWEKNTFKGWTIIGDRATALIALVSKIIQRKSILEVENKHTQTIQLRTIQF